MAALRCASAASNSVTSVYSAVDLVHSASDAKQKLDKSYANVELYTQCTYLP